MDGETRSPHWLTLEQQIACWEDAARRLVAAKDNPEKLHNLVNQLDEYGPNGPAGIGLGNYGGHAVG